MNVFIRKFQREDVGLKVTWINNDKNNKYLHYDLPLKIDKTLEWFEKNKGNNHRRDYTIVYNNEAVGLIGLLNIDYKNMKAEYYICIGKSEYKGKGIAYEASKLLLNIAFNELKLNKVYLYTEIENVVAQRLFQKLGFNKEGLLIDDLIYNGKKVSRYLYGIRLLNQDKVSDGSE